MLCPPSLSHSYTKIKKIYIYKRVVTKSLEHIATSTFNKLHVLVDLCALSRTLLYLSQIARKAKDDSSTSNNMFLYEVFCIFKQFKIKSKSSKTVIFQYFKFNTKTLSKYLNSTYNIGRSRIRLGLSVAVRLILTEVYVY